LVITTFTGIQQKARDTERTTDIKSIYSHLEAYYAQNGAYPALAEVNDGTWRGTNMKGLDDDALSDPKGTGPTLGASPSATAYAYAVFQTDGTTACTTAAADCAVYTLTATLEQGGTFEKSNLN
jgi:type II secretory pathway pseudopilin PulG